MNVKSTLCSFLLLLATFSLAYGQASQASATYSLGNIKADRSFQLPSHSSSCPGILSVNIPAGSTITGVDVVYDFEALPGSYKAFQVSQLRCVSPGGLPEATVFKNTDYTSGVLKYTRNNLTIANGVAGGGDIVFQLHAGSTFGSVPGCSELYERVLNNTWKVTVHYLPPAFPDPPVLPNPANNASNVSINVGSISWTFGANSSYYDLYFDTNNPPAVKVVNNQPAGATGSYSFGTLESGTEFFWQVVVRNDAGLQLAGPVWKFSTECLPKNVPIAMNFDNLAAPNYGGDTTKVVPLCWNLLYQNNQWYAAQSTVATSNAYSAPNCWLMSNEADPNAYSFMVMPEMAVSLATLHLSMMVKGNGGVTTISVGTMSDNTNPLSYTEFTTFTTSTVYQQIDIPFSAYNGTDKYLAVKFTSPGPNTYRYVFIDDVLISEIPTCVRPKNLTATGISQTTATVTWAEQGTASAWNIQAVPTGTAITGNFSTTTTNPFTFQGLDPSTTYDFYVQAVCGGGGVSYWSNKGMFRTACLPVAIPLFENFDASTSIPSCWLVTKTTNATASIQTYGGYSSPNSFMMSVSSSNDKVMLISPPLAVPGGSLKEVKLNFFAKRTAAEQTVIVGTLSNPLDFNSFNPIKTILPATNWAEFEVWFNNYTGTDNYIAFMLGDLSNTTQVNLDNISIGLLPYCLNPVDLFITDITETQARLNFTESREATKWQIEVGPYGFTPGTGNQTQSYTYDLSGNNYSYVMTGLSAMTFYDVFMRADCGGGVLSQWSPRARFMSQPTLYSPLPFTENFDPQITYTINPPSNLTNWSLSSALYTSVPNSIRNQYGFTNNNVLLISRRFDLSGKSNAFLSFWHIAKTQGNRDHCYVEISTDGGATFDQLPAESYLGTGNYAVPTQNLPDGPCFSELSYTAWGTGAETPDNTWWRNENFDLSAFSGSNNVVIRFRLFSDNSTNKYGWLIDDISIKTYTGVEAGINPDKIDVALESGETTTEILTITNHGDLPLVFTASVQNYSDAITTLLNENFETGFPSAWSIINGTESSPQSQWQLAQPGAAQNNMNGTNYMFVGRFFPDVCSETLLSPAFNGTDYSNVFLTFDQVYIRTTTTGAPDYAEVFVWDGATWQSVLYMKTLTIGNWGSPVTQVIDITQYANPEMKVRFYYAGNSSSRWGVDNVKITASDIPLDWLKVNGRTTYSGVLQGGQSDHINVGFEARPSFPDGKWNTEIQVVTSDPANPTVMVPVSMTIGCPQPWTYTQTGLSHTISIPANVVPEIFGEPLANGDWIGVFYLDGNGEEACGGAIQWNSGGVGFNVFGNDPTTPEKDGFAAGETFIWRLVKCGSVEQYAAMAAYDATMPNQGNFTDFGLSKLTSLQAAYFQQYTFSQGWNSLSSYLIPTNPDVVSIFAPVVNNLTILSNLTSMYWPSQGANTIGNWNSQSGYTAKFAAGTDFTIAGLNYAQTTITLPAGWSYLPVLSQCPLNVMDLFVNNLPQVVIIQELIGTRIFWPAYQVYTLQTLYPGKAYKIKLVSPLTITFPACQMKGNSSFPPQINSIGSAWGTIGMTPSSQITVFMAGSLSNFAAGDIIGAFDQNGNIRGELQITSTGENQTITLFGDDFSSVEKEGFGDQDAISFKLMNAATGDVTGLEVDYSPALDNISGNFVAGSFAAISSVKTGSTGLEDASASTIRIYPNPASETLNISGIGSPATIRIFNLLGEEAYYTQTSSSLTINVGSLAKGSYIVNLMTGNEVTVNKLVIK